MPTFADLAGASDAVPADIDVSVYSMTGKRVFHKTISKGAPGAQINLNTLTWSGLDASGQKVSPGLYYLMVVGKDGKRIKKGGARIAIIW